MVIDGKELSQEIYNEIETQAIGNIKLAIILANNDEASIKYTELKRRAGEKINITVEIFKFDQSVKKEDLMNIINKLNADNNLHGIVVQLPLFEHLAEDTLEILECIEPLKDADGLTRSSLASAFYFSEESILPAAVAAIMKSINHVISFKELSGKNVVIINNSNLVGVPLSVVLSRFNATVTICNEFTKNLTILTKEADIIISATGVTNIISANVIKKDSILIDVTSVVKEGKVYGDFIYDTELISKVKAYTPVPGGIGPLTVASLFENLIKLVKKNG